VLANVVLSLYTSCALASKIHKKYMHTTVTPAASPNLKIWSFKSNCRQFAKRLPSPSSTTVVCYTLYSWRRTVNHPPYNTLSVRNHPMQQSCHFATLRHLNACMFNTVQAVLFVRKRAVQLQKSTGRHHQTCRSSMTIFLKCSIRSAMTSDRQRLWRFQP